MALKRPEISPDRPNKRSQPGKPKLRFPVLFKARNTRSNSVSPNDRNTDCSDYNDRRSREPEQQSNEQSPLEAPSALAEPGPSELLMSSQESLQKIGQLIAEFHNVFYKYSNDQELPRESIRLVEEENSKLKSENESLLQKIEELETANEQLVSTVSQLQARAFKNIEKGGWAPKEDKWIRDEFTKLNDMIRSWSREHGACISELDNVSKKTKSNSLRDLYIAGYCSENRWDSLIKKSGESAQHLIPKLLVQAFVARDVFKNVFDPFFPFHPLFNRRDKEHGPSWPRPPELNKIYEIMKSVDAPNAHIWRSNMLRSLADLLKTDARKLIVEQPKGLFNSTPLYLFKSSSNAKSREIGLQVIYSIAFKLAQCLWTQREWHEVKPQDSYEIFDVADQQMVAHRLHHLEEGDKRLNGRATLLCVQPAIIAYGNENAEDYDVSKVWSRATLLLAEASECSDNMPKEQTNGSMDVDEVDETGSEPERDDDNDPTWPAPKTRGSIVIPLQ